MPLAQDLEAARELGLMEALITLTPVVVWYLLDPLDPFTPEAPGPPPRGPRDAAR